eukprot:3283779-Amphidinium_carterae.1
MGRDSSVLLDAYQADVVFDCNSCLKHVPVSPSNSYALTWILCKAMMAPLRRRPICGISLAPRRRMDSSNPED